jgi:hypothetical protein
MRNKMRAARKNGGRAREDRDPAPSCRLEETRSRPEQTARPELWTAHRAGAVMLACTSGGSFLIGRDGSTPPGAPLLW